MKTSWPHRSAILLTVVAFLSVLSGSAVTSNEERPFYSVGQAHVWLGAVSTILTIGLVICTRAEKEHSWLRRLCWIALAAVAVQTILGLQPLPQPPAVRIAHAFAAQLLFPVTVAIAFYTSTAWRKLPKPVDCAPFLRLLAYGTPVVVLAQVALGTLFRHGAVGVGPHLIGAFVVAMVMLGLALPIIYGPESSPLRPVAQLILTVASVQVFLGLALFSIQLMDVDPQVIILVTMIHAADGALTLTGTVMMAAEMHRSSLSSQKSALVKGTSQGANL
jgi:heme A synthase